MKKSIQFSPTRSLKHFFGRFHTILFILVILAGLVYATLLLATLLNDASIGAGYESPINAGSIDQATLDRINVLHTSDGTLSEQQQPSGRSNPFVE